MADVEVTVKICEGRAVITDRTAVFGGELVLVVSVKYERDEASGRDATYVTLRVPARLIPEPRPVDTSISVVYGRGAVRDKLCR